MPAPFKRTVPVYNPDTAPAWMAPHLRHWQKVSTRCKRLHPRTEANTGWYTHSSNGAEYPVCYECRLQTRQEKYTPALPKREYAPHLPKSVYAERAAGVLALIRELAPELALPRTEAKNIALTLGVTAAYVRQVLRRHGGSVIPVWQCVNGHDIPTVGRNANKGCKACKREANARRRNAQRTLLTVQEIMQ